MKGGQKGAVLVVATIVLLANACSDRKASRLAPEADDADQETIADWLVPLPAPSYSQGEVAAGRRLAEAYCQRCHLFPEPSLLPRHFWQNRVLPDMGLFLGMHHEGFDYWHILSSKFGAADQQIWAEESVYPELAMMTSENWRTLMAWYLEQAPEAEGIETVEVDGTLQGYQVIRAGSYRERVNVTWVGIDEERQEILYSEEDSKEFGILDADGRPLEAAVLGRVLSDCEFVGSPERRRYRLLALGSLMPSDQGFGAVLEIARSELGGDVEDNLQTIVSNLRRPTDFVFSDLVGDADPELAVAEYGNKTGRLTLFGRAEDQGLARIAELENRAGARALAVSDLNADGRKDVILLRSQGAEGVSIHYNLGDGRFAVSEPLVFPSVYGTTDMQLADFDGDGLDDLLTVHGDNGDGSYTAKSYHGIRLALNQGNGRFAHAEFLPMPGAGQARVGDFDGDGDQDFFALSQFPVWEHEHEPPLQFFRNIGGGEFERYGVPQSLGFAWMSMAAGDIDGDGDLDLVAGILQSETTHPPQAVRQRWAEQKPQPLMILKNKLR